MIRITSILSFIRFLLLVGGANAQDIHFSHIHASPLNLNPALTGVFDGDARIIANYRNQWRSATADYKTFMASTDLNLRGFNKNSIFGMGAQVSSDVAGDLNFNTTSTSISFSAMQAFDRDGSHILAGGFQFGYVSNRFDASQIISFDEEPLALDETNRNGYSDMSAGLLWFKRLQRGQYVYMGGALYHLNNPNVSFSNETTQNNTLYRRSVLHGGANFALNDFYTIQPNFIFMKQGPHQQLTLGSFVKYQNPIRKKETYASLMLGGWIRSFNLEDRLGADAIVTAIRIDIAQMIFTFTYDINISSLARATSGRGGPEFSLVYLIGSELHNKAASDKREKPGRKKKKVKCPVAHF